MWVDLPPNQPVLILAKGASASGGARASSPARSSVSSKPSTSTSKPSTSTSTSKSSSSTGSKSTGSSSPSRYYRPSYTTAAVNQNSSSSSDMLPFMSGMVASDLMNNSSHRSREEIQDQVNQAAAQLREEQRPLTPDEMFIQQVGQPYDDPMDGGTLALICMGIMILIPAMLFVGKIMIE